MITYLKSKYYPVDITGKIIYNDPQKREMDCSFTSKKYAGLPTIGIKGQRLNQFKCYQFFEVRDDNRIR